MTTTESSTGGPPEPSISLAPNITVVDCAWTACRTASKQTENLATDIARDSIIVVLCYRGKANANKENCIKRPQQSEEGDA
jgi:hypothetical protein